MTHPSQSQQWQFPCATQLPASDQPPSFAYVPSSYPPYLPIRPPSPSQRNPYSPEPQASPAWSDGGYTGSGEEYATPELESAGPSSIESNFSSLFAGLSPQVGSPASPAPSGLAALESPPNELVRPEATVNIMIKAALQDSPLGKLPSRDILKAIQTRFPFYAVPKHAEKLSNTIRHHLSNSKMFVKVAKDVNMKGKGDYWMYDPETARARAGIDGSAGKSTAGPSRRRSPPARASSPYPRTRRAAHRGSEDTITQRSVGTGSSHGVGPIRVSPKVRPSTRLALPDDRLPSNPRPIRPAAGGLMSTRQGHLQQRPSHGLWSPRVPVGSVPSSPESLEAALDGPEGLMQRVVADRNGLVHTRFLQSPPGVAPNISSSLQCPVPQITYSLAESSLLDIACSNQIPSFPAPSLPALDLDGPNSESFGDAYFARYINLEGPFDQSYM